MRLDRSGPDDDARRPRAALVDAALAVPQRVIVGGRAALDHVVHVPPVVGGEDDDRLVGDLQLVEPVEHAADALVEALQHGRHDRTALLPARVCPAAAVFHELLLRLKRRVHGVVPQAEEERTMAVIIDVLEGLVGETVGEVLALGPVNEGLDAVRREVARRAGVVTAGDVDVEALLLRPPRLVAEVPLADEARGIAGLLERLRQRPLLQRQEAPAPRADHLQPRLGGLAEQRGIRLRREMPGRRGDLEARGVLARHDARPGRRAQRVGGVGVGEQHTPSRQPLEVRRLIVPAAVDRAVHPAHVVGEDHDDVAPARRRVRRRPQPAHNHRRRPPPAKLQETPSVHFDLLRQDATGAILS